jgi:hypothetical protein
MIIAVKQDKTMETTKQGESSHCSQVPRCSKCAFLFSKSATSDKKNKNVTGVLEAGNDTGGPGNLSIPIWFYYRIKELNF